MWWLFIIYAVALGLVVFLSNKVATYTDVIEKRTKVSGALMGGIVLAGITSLPELVTSITSSLLGEPELVQGDIFGSNIFDICIIGVIMLIFAKTVKKTKISKDNAKFVLYCMVITALIIIQILLGVFAGVSLTIPYININALTIFCIVLYLVAVFTTHTTKDTEQVRAGEHINVKEDTPKHALKPVIIKFVVCSVLLIGVSVAITFLSNSIANEYGLNKGLAGTLFLGVATSMPEIVGSFTLVRMGNYNSAYGNIIGSCLFNFMILGIADIFYFGGTVFLSNLTSLYVCICMIVALFGMLLSYILKRFTKKGANLVTIPLCGVLCIASFIVSLVVLA